jgi:hypothetical protein
MSSNLRRVVGSFLLGVTSVAGVSAQDWGICLDPNANPPRSNTHGVNIIENDLMVASIGLSGTATYFGPNSPCINGRANNANITANLRGRIGFSIGTQGSIQTDFDNNMALTFGMPFDPAGAWSYAVLTVLDAQGVRTKTLFGANALTTFYVGASHRYQVAETINDGVRINCRIDLIGDAARLQWTLTNQGAPRPLGLWFGQWIAMLSSTPDPATGASISSGVPVIGLGGKDTYVVVPGQKPGIIDTRWTRNAPGVEFPAYLEFDFGQTTAYGFKIENGPTPSTTNPRTGQSDATQASEVVVGNAGLLLGAPDGGDNTLPDGILPDTFLGTAAYIQKFAEITVPTGGTRQIRHYFRSTWGNANYALPYTAVVDTPRLLATDDDGSGSLEANGLFKNPFPFRVYVDNVGGYSDVNSGLPLSDVKVKVTLPVGLNFVGEDPSVRTKQQIISQVNFQTIEAADFQVEADGIEFGELPYTVVITPAAPFSSKTINGTVQVAATPRYRLFDIGGNPTTNAITTPFTFTDTSWPVVLGLSSPNDFQAFEWDPQLKGYVISTSAARGKGVFIVNFTGTTQSNPLGGNPTTPVDTPPLPNNNSGRVVVQLRSGWNLIGNPYNYPIVVGQMVGVSASNPEQSRTWAQLVSQGIVSSSLAYWVASTQSYKFLQKGTDNLQPNTAYWLYVNTTSDLTLSFPPVFTPGLPNSSRSVDWTQSDKQWRLNLTARTDRSIDDQNYIGVVPNAETATTLRMMEPPMSPTQEVALSVEGQQGGLPISLAQNLSEKSGKQEFKVSVQAKKDGEVNLTWPNMSTVPKNVRFRLVDTTASTAKDMRSSSGYSYTATAGSTREFKVQVDVGGPAVAVIGNVLVTRSKGRGEGSPFVINYTLSSAASTTIRILGGNGKEVFTVTRGRADAAGQNTAQWNLKDNANRSVAPGSYRMEIVATTPEGDNVRRIVPINVVRG